MRSKFFLHAVYWHSTTMLTCHLQRSRQIHTWLFFFSSMAKLAQQHYHWASAQVCDKFLYIGAESAAQRHNHLVIPGARHLLVRLHQYFPVLPDWWYSRSLFHWLKKNNSFQVHKNWQVRIAIAQQQCFINEPQNIHNLFTWRDALSSKISRTLHANVKVICGDWNRNMLSHQQLHVLFIAVLQQGLLASLIGSSEIYPSFSFLHVLVQNFPRYPSSG